MDIKVRAEMTRYKDGKGETHTLLINLLPSISIRYVDWALGYEYDIYFSWLVWGLIIMAAKPKTNV